MVLTRRFDVAAMVSKWELITRSCEFHGYHDSAVISRTIDDSLKELYPDDYHKYGVCEELARKGILDYCEMVILAGSVENCVACNVDFDFDIAGDGIGCEKCRFGSRHNRCGRGSIIERFTVQLALDAGDYTVGEKCYE